MTLSEALHMLRWTHCSIMIELEPNGRKLQYQPTISIDELGSTYRRILKEEWLQAEVIRIEPTTFNYANIYIEDVRKGKEHNGRFRLIEKATK